ncbi:transposase [Pectobacterium carotovorum]|uniref:transposase n=1 Tax=Pectobacterium carotovorum TaxID=554 RepID=UPI00301B1F0B
MSTEERRSRKHYSPELKLKLVKMALESSKKGNSVAAIAREYAVNDNLLFKWMRLWQREGQISRPRRKYRKTASPALLPVTITQPTPAMSPVTTTDSARDIICHARLRQGDITLHNPSLELMSLMLREMMSGEPR